MRRAIRNEAGKCGLRRMKRSSGCTHSPGGYEDAVEEMKESGWDLGTLEAAESTPPGFLEGNSRRLQFARTMTAPSQFPLSPKTSSSRPQCLLLRRLLDGCYSSRCRRAWSVSTPWAFRPDTYRMSVIMADENSSPPPPPPPSETGLTDTPESRGPSRPSGSSERRFTISIGVYRNNSRTTHTVQILRRPSSNKLILPSPQVEDTAPRRPRPGARDQNPHELRTIRACCAPPSRWS